MTTTPGDVRQPRDSLASAHPAPSHWYRVSCAAGSERWLEDELHAQGAQRIRAAKGSVSFFGDWHVALRVLLWSRVGQRLALRLGEAPCADAQSLYGAARSVPWEEWLGPGCTIAVAATGRTAELRNTQFVAQLVKDAVVDRLRDRTGSRPDVDRAIPTLSILVHVAEGRAWLGLDVAGAPLYLRGYREAQTEAPLKETLAATLLLASSWTPGVPLVDPMCGSGTIAIEAAWMALGRPPGRYREPAALWWPPVGADLAPVWNALCARADNAERPHCQAIIGAADASAHAVQTARRNARAARVDDELSFRVERVESLVLPQGPGVVVANPPYGERLADQRSAVQALDALRDLARRYPDYRCFALVPDTARPRSGERVCVHVYNGAIPCVILAL